MEKDVIPLALAGMSREITKTAIGITLSFFGTNHRINWVLQLSRLITTLWGVLHLLLSLLVNSSLHWLSTFFHFVSTPDAMFHNAVFSKWPTDAWTPSQALLFPILCLYKKIVCVFVWSWLLTTTIYFPPCCCCCCSVCLLSLLIIFWGLWRNNNYNDNCRVLGLNRNRFHHQWV